MKYTTLTRLATEKGEIVVFASLSRLLMMRTMFRFNDYLIITVLFLYYLGENFPGLGEDFAFNFISPTPPVN